jgi:metallo-beta-lactamase family protein
LRGFATPLAATYVVHGEPDAARSLAERIRAELGWRVDVPSMGDTVSLRAVTASR